ncbi:glycosyltransferase [Paenibacillus flagellatus]|uniref:Glycosyltransferase n=1 Tax=Paenibacillus flagellatus TaxID=2211139 RepID=A0A2V5KC85_9BACL|nr:glycosyltransferase [Paenibacillus flagellatus]PYI57201.1 hypothetical protein DLM86_01805 [Paenibacillus flagellatus]
MNGSGEKLKIVYIIGTLIPGGAERHLIELMKSLDRSEFHPIVYCMNDKGVLAEQVEAMSIQVKPFGYKTDPTDSIGVKIKKVIRLILDLRKSLRKDRPQIVHSYLFWPNTFGTIAAKLAGIRFTITSRRSLGLFKNGRPMMQRIENAINLLTDVITVNSQEVLNDTVRREKYVRDKLALVYNGVDLNKFSTSPGMREVWKRELKIPADHLVITNVANLALCKGHVEFLEAAAELLKSNPKLTFLLIGRDRGMLDSLTDLARELKISNNVQFLGGCNNVEEILNTSDIQVLSSYEEGFSNAILEGMAVSLPMVVTNVGGNAEAVIDGYNGFVVPPKNSIALAKAMSRLIEDVGLRQTMGWRGRTRAESLFGLQAMADSYRSLYLELMDKGRIASYAGKGAQYESG